MDIEALLNFRTKLGLTGCMELIIFLIFFDQFQLSLKKQWVVLCDFMTKKAIFKVFHAFVCFTHFLINNLPFLSALTPAEGMTTTTL